MMAKVSRCYYCLIILLLSIVAGAGTSTAADDEAECTVDANGQQNCDQPNANDDNSGNAICTMYLAPSSIPNAGMGIFTTHPYKMHEAIFNEQSPSVMFLDRELHMPADANWPLFDYVWQTYGAGTYEARVAETWEPTPLGTLANYHPYLTNYAHHGNGQRYDDAMASRFTDPEAGAFSYHTSFAMGAKRDIEAGEELFADYGEGYLDVRSHEDENVYRLIPREEDYEKAAQVAQNLSKLKEVPRDAAEAIQAAVSGLANERVASLLPKDPSTYAKYRRMDLEQIGFDLAWGTVERRSIDWIVENGQCLDGRFEVRQSSIPKAGHGAFATQRIAKGEMIVPTALLHVADKELLNMYNRTIDPVTGEKMKRPLVKDPETGRYTTQEDKSIGKQMLMNYCFGHRESSILLCPTNGVSVMNHCSTRTKSQGQCNSKQGANAGYRWPEDWAPESKEWLQLSYEELIQRHGRGLTLEIYATRDIEIGDEIFLDYGPGWEEEWENHVRSWSPPEEGGTFGSYASVKELNDSMEPPRTEAELAANPLPDNVVTGCMFTADYNYPYDEFEAGFDWSTLSDDEILKNFADDGSEYVWQEINCFPRFWPCSVMSGNDKDGYIVRIFQASWEYDTPWAQKGLPMFLTNYPRESIRYFNKQGLSDQHLPNAFRHYPELPDDIFPEQWKNLI